MNVVQLFDDLSIMKEIREETTTVIHHTKKIKPIKRLISISEILDLNIKIKENYKEMNGIPVWDIPSLQEMNRERIELLVFHAIDFNPPKIIMQYNLKIRQLLSVIMMSHPKWHGLFTI